MKKIKSKGHSDVVYSSFMKREHENQKSSSRTQEKCEERKIEETTMILAIAHRTVQNPGISGSEKSQILGFFVRFLGPAKGVILSGHRHVSLRNCHYSRK